MSFGVSFNTSLWNFALISLSSWAVFLCCTCRLSECLCLYLYPLFSLSLWRRLSLFCLRFCPSSCSLLIISVSISVIRCCSRVTFWSIMLICIYIWASSWFASSSNWWAIRWSDIQSWRILAPHFGHVTIVSLIGFEIRLFVYSSTSYSSSLFSSSYRFITSYYCWEEFVELSALWT